MINNFVMDRFKVVVSEIWIFNICNLVEFMDVMCYVCEGVVVILLIDFLCIYGVLVFVLFFGMFLVIVFGFDLMVCMLKVVVMLIVVYLYFDGDEIVLG